MRKIQKILIANRGEIACRIIKTAKKMGIKTVSVYSSEDCNSLHGSAESKNSYLNSQRILDIFKQTNSEAIHPGYGFLSENYKFVQFLESQNISFIGPNSKSMAMMGDKIASKQVAAQAGVKSIPGFNGEVSSDEQAIQIGNDIGYPVIIKASAGGGGKGMRICWSESELLENLKIAQTEAESSFGDSRVLIEKYLLNPRHIEFQLIGDQFGSIVYLPERECSIQRRSQKVLEESPSPNLSPELRKKMGEQAVSLAKAVGYYSAGTCEFLVDGEDYYFLEMNTRLQVEHPITELVTGLDLVEEMIRVANGEKLRFTQEDVAINGWAMESRIYAEHPSTFMPSVGLVSKYVEPQIAGVRNDSGITQGTEISMYYDPLISKLCVHAENRMLAIEKMKIALDSYVIEGVTNNIPLLRDILEQPVFQAGDTHTSFLPSVYPEGFSGYLIKDYEKYDMAMLAGLLFLKRKESENSWIQNGNIVSNQSNYAKLFITVADSTFEVNITKYNNDSLECEIDSKIYKITQNGNMTTVNDHTYILQHSNTYLGFVIQLKGTRFEVSVKTPIQHSLSEHLLTTLTSINTKNIQSPMPGTILSINCSPDQYVRKGQVLCVIEAMKMQNMLRCPRNGMVKKIHVELNERVLADQLLIELENEPPLVKNESQV
ncbi:hypothetical protein HDV01_007495 [Terramyces sp. JEL0728]|nr:hypothetical protein HDV01_007495 [Terramyces sp. JEL0728]